MSTAVGARGRSVAAHILVAVAALVLAGLAVVAGFLLGQYNFVTRMVWLVGTMAVGWVPLVLTIIAVCLRTTWLTVTALVVSAAAFAVPILAVVVGPAG
ncbi:hypothetical protein KNO15_19245 [Leifsonia shinshuensis]|uniref:hypothetical protein n=1 Tax=Leifsonia shinshuensis TaxID=150026 RepID=UPI001F506F69|nr:hypothetical protein [Leifsonia shinshuensis]MCI0158842.1 hypothetical protein [Leifsonia shinshuensis]